MHSIVSEETKTYIYVFMSFLHIDMIQVVKSFLK